MKVIYNTPGGEFCNLYADMLEQNHVLIAGATGSGKSTVINGMIHAAMYKSPIRIQFIMLDPKKCELFMYRDLPHTLAYADEPHTMLAALEDGLEIINDRFTEMQSQRVREYTGSHIYIFVDELADLLTTPGIKKKAAQVLQRVCQIGRAAHVHVVAATQFIPAIPTAIRCNFDCKMALRTATAQDSRNILGVKGAEQLPDPKQSGKCYGYYLHGADLELYSLMRIEEAEIERLITHWRNPRNVRKYLVSHRSA